MFASPTSWGFKRPNAIRRGRPGRCCPSVLDFSGEKYALEHEGVGVAVNTGNQGELGSLGLLHCHRVVHPLVIGGDDVDWLLDDLVDQCHRKKGLVVWSDQPFDADLQFGEALLPTILGKVNAFEFASRDGSHEIRLQRWYTLLNAGLPLRWSGPEGSRTTPAWSVACGP